MELNGFSLSLYTYIDEKLGNLFNSVSPRGFRGRYYKMKSKSLLYKLLKNMKITKLILLAALVSTSHAVVTTIDTGLTGAFTDAVYDYTAGTVTKTNTFTTTDLDGDGVDDTFTFDVVGTYNSGTDGFGSGTAGFSAQLVSSSGGDFSDSSFTFAASNFNVSLSSGTLNSINFLGFDGAVLAGFIQNTDAANVAGTAYSVAAGDSSPMSFALTDTVDIEATGGGFRINNLQYQVEIDTEVAAVPEPTSAALLGLGGLTLIARRKRQA